MSDIKLILSEQDTDREYRYITLPNKLDALLISEKDTEKSAASMDVRAGYFCDPKSTAGLAHFCEHMLFLGTEKYPDEQEFINYITKNGGRHNAFTSSEDTNYYFDIEASAFDHALDQFAQFFIKPLFHSDSTQREMEAINSEHSKNIQTDSWRSAGLLSSTASPNHPFSNFGTGNLETLQHHKDIIDQLTAFHSKYYSANGMKLVVLSGEPLDAMEKSVREKFSSVPNTDAVFDTFNGVPFEKGQLRKLYKIVPVKDFRSLEVFFPIPSLIKYWKQQPLHHISHLIGHEGEGSILSVLKNKGWATALVSGNSRECLDFAIFKTSVELTVEGVDHVDEIIGIIFQYIALLRREGVVDWIYNELAQLSDIGFRFKDKEEPISYVSTLSSNMHVFPPEHVLSGQYLLHEFDPQLVHKFLDYLSPENCRVHLSSHAYKGHTDVTEEWYGIEYSVQDITDQQIQKWRDTPATGLVLPEKNLFIPDVFDLKKPNPDYSSSLPVLIRNTALSRVWYKQDQTFNKPKVSIIFDIASPLAYTEPETVVMTKLYTTLLAEILNEFSYSASVAGLKYSVYNTVDGLQLIVSGYDCKQTVLLTKILEKMADLKFDSEQFEIFKEKARREYRNFHKEQPYSRAIYNTTLCLENTRWTNEEYLIAVEEVTFDKLVKFIPQLTSKLFFESLMIGNITHDEAIATAELVEKIVKVPKPVYFGQLVERRYVRLEPGKTYVHRMKGLNPAETNAAVVNTYQIGLSTIRGAAILDLFSQISQAPVFSTLRTKEQLGYIVGSAAKHEHGIDSFMVIVQSGKQAPLHIDERIEAFLESFQEALVALSDEEFQENVDGLIATKLEKPKSLKVETSHYVSEILHPKMYIFDRNAQEAKELETVTKQEILDFFNQHISPKSANRKKLTCQIFGNTQEIPAPVPAPNVVYIEQFRAFKRVMDLYPLRYNGADRFLGPDIKPKL